MRHPVLRGLILAAAAVFGLAAAPVSASDPCADYIPQPKPQNTARDYVGQSIDEIRERGFMTFALYEDYPPYSWEEAGQPRGIDVDLARIIAEFAGVEARFNFITAGENLDADLRNHIWKGPLVGGAVSNVMMRVPYDSAFTCRVEQVSFGGVYAEESIAIAYDRAQYPEEKPVPAYFRFDTVAVENDAIADFYLSNFAGGQLQRGIRRFPSMEAAMGALRDGETMAAMGPRAQLEYGADDGVGIHEPPLAGFAKARWKLGVAVHFSWKPLYYEVTDALSAALADGRIAAVYESYGLTHQPPQW
ncbi:Bacterial extracellular solute-binding protein, family 3 [Roseivivax sp. THAF40]|uniref:substrate-binding periplasmic protein n=1 Tax=unclassified Roseivivax TaxID=2639302 RepID=UPI0012682F6B|nr:MULTISPECIES: transporter substrate-binding domain-containing protein [unclassified Roseivivax]QFS84522.1 Bacterial extracellular solute-binding protein, family 3 [Roseivivax sp. THAF197b]QFT48350.1 Bacterial extracellular solute-binding protein, family 3 [Roseivivax sp. THAF40]